MENFIEVELKSGEKVCIARDKIIAVTKHKEHALVYCLGSFSNGNSIGFTVAMTYQDFVNLLK